jgi:tripartite-type tricarboxylate transporter receptor subunit TctC
MRCLLVACLAIVVLARLGSPTWAQSPGPTRIVVPFPPGGSADILARLLSEQIGNARGSGMVVENRAGAATAIGTEAVARAVGDGSTLLLTNNAFVINPQVRKLNYDPLRSFEPVCRLVSVPVVVVVHSASSYRTLADLLDAARARPGELTVGSIHASVSHLTFESLKRTGNINMVFVPYPGSAPAVSALLGGHLTSASGDYPVMAELIKSGKLRALATLSSKRSGLLPDVPTLAESGFKDFETDLWNGLLAPAETPTETLEQLIGWFTSAITAPQINAKLVAHGLVADLVCGKQFGALLRSQYDSYGRIIRETNITGE